MAIDPLPRVIFDGGAWWPALLEGESDQRVVVPLESVVERECPNVLCEGGINQAVGFTCGDCNGAGTIGEAVHYEPDPAWLREQIAASIVETAKMGTAMKPPFPGAAPTWGMSEYDAAARIMALLGFSSSDKEEA